MKIKSELYSEWGTLVRTLIIETDCRTFRQFANQRGYAISPGDTSFTSLVGHKMKQKNVYTLISK
jgi:hypothetical protein